MKGKIKIILYCIILFILSFPFLVFISHKDVNNLLDAISYTANVFRSGSIIGIIELILISVLTYLINGFIAVIIISIVLMLSYDIYRKIELYYNRVYFETFRDTLDYFNKLKALKIKDIFISMSLVIVIFTPILYTLYRVIITIISSIL